MINERTVFVLGAGSNTVYGFPTGFMLRDHIIKNFENYFHKYLVKIPPRYRGLTKRFVENFDRSHINSIDRFLAERSNDFYEIGTMAIALSILQKECNCKFSKELDYGSMKDDLYFYLYNIMISGIEEGFIFEQFKNNKVSFITFNYDRSLDFFLYDSFSNSLPFEQLQQFEFDKMKHFPFNFIHVYGSTPLEWQSNNPPYLKFMKGKGFDEITLSDIQQFAESIRIIQKSRNKEPFIIKVQEEILRADQIFFLGFGFAQENLEVLGIPDILKGKRVYGTVKGWSEKNIMGKLRQLNNEKGMHIYPLNNNKGFKKGSINLMNASCIELLEEYL
jgi:hypothetical protein